MYQFTSPPKQNCLLFKIKWGSFFFSACTNLNIASIIPLDPSSPGIFFFFPMVNLLWYLKFLVCFSRHISVCHRIVFLYILFTFIDIYVFSYGGNINDSNIIRRDVSRLFCYYKLFILSVMWSRIVLFESGLGLVINVNCKPLKK